MADRDGIDFRRYGLTNGDPFVDRELDASKTEDRQLLLPFSGFPSDELIDDHIRNTTKNGGSTAFLVSGRSATGRTTTANTIIHRYTEHAGSTDYFHVVPYREKNHDSTARIHAILKAVRNTVIRQTQGHRKTLRAEFPDGDGRGLSALDLQERAEFLADYVEEIKPPIRVGALIDGIQDDSFMDTLAMVFENVATVIVVTRDDYHTPDTASEKRLNERARWQDWAMHIRLPALTGSDMSMLADNRWTSAAPELDCPFALDGLRTTFDSRPKPVGAALPWLRWLLHGRLSEYRGAGCWPAARELEISAAWIEFMVSHHENAPPDRTE